MQHVRTLVVGAGPTGLGAAWRLNERGETDWLLVEQAQGPGGAAASVRDDEGFIWDLGGHVIHSHYAYFDRVLASCDVDWVYPQRNGFVFLDGVFIPVPLQQNLALLPPALLDQVRQELAVAWSGDTPTNLEQWFQSSFGSTLTARFFTPFNTKMWAHPPKLLAHSWTSLRSGSTASNVPLPRLGAAVVQDRTRFPYPRHGSGALWDAVARELPPARLRYDAEVVAVSAGSKVVRLRDGELLSYTEMVSSMPLTRLVRQVHGREWAELLHSSVEVIGFGFEGDPPAALADMSWIYHADLEVPFHRATLLSNYSQDVAGPGRWSVLLECGTSSHRRLDEDSLVRSCLTELQSWGVGTPVSTWRRFLPLGYPVPSSGRDEMLAPLMDELELRGVRSRGRFGGWRYESCNQDYAFMQGVQAVDAGFDDVPEDVFWPDRPQRVLS